MKWNKWWTGGLAVIVVAGACGGYFWWAKKDEQPLQAALQTTQVHKGSLEVKISATGNIETANRAALSSSSSGKIATVEAGQGDKVKKGQVLATFEQADTSSVQNQIRSKKLDLQKKQIDLEALQAQYKQADEDAREQLEISIQKQQLDMESVKADIEALQEDDGDTLDPITAPIDGTLATFALNVGDTIGGQGGGTSASLGEVVDYEHLQMVVGVDELDISQVKLGQQATILVEALADQTFAGKVTAIAQEGTASNGVATFDVTIALDDAANLKAGMSAEASILTEQKADALYLPIEAVQSFGGRYFVMVPSSTGGSGTAAGSADGQSQQGQTPPQQQEPQQQGQTQQGQTQQQQRQFPQQGQTRQDQGAFGGQTGSAARQNRQSAFAGQSGVTRVPVEVGIHNEDYIEIVSGLNEGDAVVIPTVAGTSTQAQGGNVGIPGLGIGGGAGGFPGGAGGFPAGGAGGGRFQGQGGGTQAGRAGG